MEINSSIARVDHSTEQLFSKLTRVETYEGLMPKGAAFTKIDDSRFRFKLGGMPEIGLTISCLLYTSPSPRDMRRSRMPSSA